MRELVRTVLNGGYEFREAVDGVECVELAQRLRPDLLILDLMLPGKSGLEVLTELRADPALADAPVLVVSAWSHLDRDAVAAGADRFLVKPFEPDELEAAVAELVAAG